MSLATSRTNVVSSFTIIKGSLIDESRELLREWDLSCDRTANLERLRRSPALGGRSENWRRDVAKVLQRRLDPAGRDRPLLELARTRATRETWSAALLWHMTRD